MSLTKKHNVWIFVGKSLTITSTPIWTPLLTPVLAAANVRMMKAKTTISGTQAKPELNTYLNTICIQLRQKMAPKSVMINHFSNRKIIRSIVIPVLAISREVSPRWSLRRAISPGLKSMIDLPDDFGQYFRRAHHFWRVFSSVTKNSFGMFPPKFSHTEFAASLSPDRSFSVSHLNCRDGLSDIMIQGILYSTSS